MSGLSELAPLLKAEVVAAVKMVGFFDESEDQSILCIAGVVAPIHHWAPFEDAWSALVKAAKIEPEFHMYDCEAGKGAFAGWSNPRERQQAAHQFLSMFADNPYPSPMGVVVAIDLDAYNSGQHSTKPWLAAFVHATRRMLELQDETNLTTGESDRVALFFDEKDEFRARALRMVEEARTQANHGSLLGTVSFGDSADYPALQAADLLAYECRRCVTEVIKGQKPAREPWRRIQAAKMPNGQPRLWAEYYDSRMADFRELSAW